MTAADWLVFAVYFGGVVGLALYQSRKNVGVEGYFLANRRLPWGAVGLSVMADPGERHNLHRDNRAVVRRRGWSSSRSICPSRS